VSCVSGCFLIGPRWETGKKKESYICMDLCHGLWVYAMAQLVVALRYRVAGSIPDGVIGIFH